MINNFPKSYSLLDNITNEDEYDHYNYTNVGDLKYSDYVYVLSVLNIICFFLILFLTISAIKAFRFLA